MSSSIDLDVLDHAQDALAELERACLPRSLLGRRSPALAGHLRVLSGRAVRVLAAAQDVLQGKGPPPVAHVRQIIKSTHRWANRDTGQGVLLTQHGELWHRAGAVGQGWVLVPGHWCVASAEAWMAKLPGTFRLNRQEQTESAA